MERHKEQGSRAALFPALSEGSREKRAVSILLACMEQVPELTETLLQGQGAPLGKRSKIQAWTEVGIIGGKGAARPDGKIMIRTSRGQQWAALVEAKIGKGQLDAEQIETYLGSGRTEGVNALITISNDFAVLPTHHPTYKGKVPKGMSLLHWSWCSVLTKCRLLTDGGEIEDRDHRWVVEHLVRFLNHPSTGVTRFDRMPTSWKEITAAVAAGAMIRRNDEATLEAVAGWVQETRDLGLQLTELLHHPVSIKMGRAERADPAAAVTRILEALCNEQKLEVEYDIPDGVSPLKVTADLRSKTLTASMTVGAPEDRKTAKACTNWLLRALTKTDPGGVHIKAAYGGRRQDTQEALDKIRENPNTLDSVDPKICPKRFEVKIVSDIGRRMEGQKTFVQALEKLVPEFYTQVGQHLRTWIPSAPRVGSAPAPSESSDAEKSAQGADDESFGGEGQRTERGDGSGAEELHGPDKQGGHVTEGASEPEPTSGPVTQIEAQGPVQGRGA